MNVFPKPSFCNEPPFVKAKTHSLTDNSLFLGLRRSPRNGFEKSSWVRDPDPFKLLSSFKVVYIKK